MLIGCKCDEARTNRQVTKEEATAWAEAHHMSYIETSAKEKENVQQSFEQITKCIFEDMKDRNGKMAPINRNANREQSVNLQTTTNKKQGKGGCC